MDDKEKDRLYRNFLKLKKQISIELCRYEDNSGDWREGYCCGLNRALSILEKEESEDVI